MSEVLLALGHETRELLARVIGQHEGVTGARLKELVRRASGKRITDSAFWFHLNHLRKSGVVVARRRASPSLDSEVGAEDKVEAGSPIYLTLNKKMVRDEIERLAREFGWLAKG